MNKDYIVLDEVNKINKVKWNDFVINHPEGNIFQTPFFFYVYHNTKKYEPTVIIILNTNNEIIGVQLSVVVKLYNSILGSLTSRSIIFGGPLVLNNSKEVLEKILTVYKDKIKNKALYSEYRNMWDWGDLKKAFIRNRINFEDHLDILLDLSAGEEKLWKEMKRVRRKGINQSYKKNITVSEIDLSLEDQLVEAYSIIESVYVRIKLPLHEIDFFRNAKTYLGDNMLTLGLFVENELIAVRIALCYNSVVYDWYAGANEEFLGYRPNDVLPWELMKWGMDNNFKQFDFGGAGKPNIPYGVREHKLKFGGELVNYGRFKIIHNPTLMMIAKIGFRIKQRISNII